MEPCFEPLMPPAPRTRRWFSPARWGCRQVLFGVLFFSPAGGLTWRLFIAGCNSPVEPVARAARKKSGCVATFDRIRGSFHLLAAGEPRREIGNRPRIDVGLVPFLDDLGIGRSWSPSAATLPTIPPKEIGSRGQTVGHGKNETTAAVAVEIDREFKIG